MIDHLLRLYPAAYRRAHGAEIAATYRELTAGEPLGPRLRDAAELAGHALRLRAGLGPGTAAARMLGTAYPLVLVASAAASGLHLLRWYAAVAASPAPLGVQLRSDLSGVWGVLLLSSLLVFAGAAAALAGRWRAGVPCTVAGLLAFATAAVASGPALGDPVAGPAAAVLAAAALLGCPPDRRTEALAVGRAGTAGVAVALVLVPRAAVAAHAVPWISTDYGCWPLLVLAAAAAVTAWRNGSRGGDSRGARELAVRELAALALASPLLLAQAGTVAWGDPTALAVLATVLTAALAAVPLAGRLGRSRR
ncbi:hypothetical protein ACFY2K_07445 [Kitasatospora sp. NPDC001309]|uniref:hypothetical protein n=1 Tax=Kitasatospora sp. NPDC001309 TaxID=3364013 RepID=UPI003675C1EC